MNEYDKNDNKLLHDKIHLHPFLLLLRLNLLDLDSIRVVVDHLENLEVEDIYEERRLMKNE